MFELGKAYELSVGSVLETRLASGAVRILSDNDKFFSFFEINVDIARLFTSLRVSYSVQAVPGRRRVAVASGAHGKHSYISQ